MYIAELKAKLHICVSFFLAIIMLGSTVGYTATSHTCGGKVVLTAISLTQKNLTCGMQKKQSSCPRHKKMASSCCSNQHELNQLQENFNHSKPNIEKIDMNPRPLGIMSLMTPFNIEKLYFFERFKVPPDIIVDYTKWFQVMRL